MCSDRFAFLHLRREFQCDHHFADAHGMQPGHAVVRQLCPRLLIIEAEALPEFVPVVAAPQHLRDVGREKEEERQREKQIVDEPDHSAGTM